MSEKLYCGHCHGVWVSAAAHGMAHDLEACLHCGGPLTLEPPTASRPRGAARPTPPRPTAAPSPSRRDNS